MKVSDPEKIKRALSLLQEGKTHKEIRAIIQKEFDSGISPSTLVELNRKLEGKNQELQDLIKSHEDNFPHIIPIIVKFPKELVMNLIDGIAEGKWKDEQDAILDIIRMHFRKK
jgi:hypothetical protein